MHIYAYVGVLFMPSDFDYNPTLGKMYAQTFALNYNVPPDQRLFYYADGQDCTNFISQCVWAAYGGWIPGFTEDIVRKNAERILNDVRQVRGIWYGSKSNIGSNRWCRVEEFYSYVTDTGKRLGPMAQQIAEGDWLSVDPGIINEGDVIQLVVTTYIPDRYGHGLYVTKSGPTWDDVLICCHTDDKLDEPLGWFAQFPDEYKKLRVLRFTAGRFSN